jgi:hypothetical protein
MAIKANIVIDQGSDFSTEISVTDDNGDPVNLTGYSAAAQMRKHYTSATAISFVALSMNAATSSNVTAGRYVYDCEITSSSNVVSRLVEGIVTVTPQVTR